MSKEPEAAALMGGVPSNIGKVLQATPGIGEASNFQTLQKSINNGVVNGKSSKGWTFILSSSFGDKLLGFTIPGKFTFQQSILTNGSVAGSYTIESDIEKYNNYADFLNILEMLASLSSTGNFLKFYGGKVKQAPILSLRLQPVLQLPIHLLPIRLSPVRYCLLCPGVF